MGVRVWVIFSLSLVRFMLLASCCVKSGLYTAHLSVSIRSLRRGQQLQSYNMGGSSSEEFSLTSSPTYEFWNREGTRRVELIRGYSEGMASLIRAINKCVFISCKQQEHAKIFCWKFCLVFLPQRLGFASLYFILSMNIVMPQHCCLLDIMLLLCIVHTEHLNIGLGFCKIFQMNNAIKLKVLIVRAVWCFEQ